MRACDEVEPHLGGEWIREERARRIEHSKECAESYLLDKGTLPKRAVMCQERKLRRHGLTGCCLFKSIARRGHKCAWQLTFCFIQCMLPEMVSRSAITELIAFVDLDLATFGTYLPPHEFETSR